MPKSVDEFRYPPKATDVNKLKNADAFWGWSIQDASKFTKQAAHAFDWLQFFLNNFTLQVLVLAWHPQIL